MNPDSYVTYNAGSRTGQNLDLLRKFNSKVEFRVNRNLTPEMRATSNQSFSVENKSHTSPDNKFDLPMPIIYCPNIGLLESNRQLKKPTFTIVSKNDRARESITAMSTNNKRFSMKDQPYKSIIQERSSSTSSKHDQRRFTKVSKPQIMISDESVIASSSNPAPSRNIHVYK
jgi:hypothetical protein